MSLKKNVIANYFGQGWRVIMSLAFVPLYIKYLGIEAYGLIGIFVMLQAWLSLLDLGMRPTLAREMARFTGGDHDAQSIWDLLRSIEFVALGIAVFIGFSVWTASDWLARDWVQLGEMPVDIAARAFVLMGFVIALRFIENIYTNSIAGLQQQVLQNVVVSIMETFRGVGAVVVLVWIEPTIDAFFIWQGLISLATAIIFMIFVYRILPQSPRAACFSLPALQNIWRFAAGMFGITLLALLLTQMDKILLSRMLSLEAFGYYALASLVATGLYVIATPIGAAFYPRFAELLARKETMALTRTYHLGSQLITVIMGSATVVLVIFADRILLLWTADPELVEQVAPVMMILALGTFFNGLMWMPYQMQLAYGWTSLSIRINIIAVVCIVPAVIWSVPIYGAMGAAYVWLVLNLGYCVIGVHFMYRRILIEEKWAWYRTDVLIPLTISVVTGLLCYLVFSSPYEPIYELFVLAVISLVVLTSAGLSAPLVRLQVVSHVPQLLYKCFKSKGE